MPRGPDFFRQMNADQISALEEFARIPGKTVDEVHEHLKAVPVKCGRSAVGVWLQDFKVWDRAHRAAESRAKYMELSDKLDPGATAKATHRLLGERIYELALNADDPDTIDKLTRSHERIVGVLDQLEERDRQISAAKKAIEDGEKVGTSATDVVATIKAALGIASAP